MSFRAYFEDESPEKWRIERYLDACLKITRQKGTPFNFETTIIRYREYLEHIKANQPASREAVFAQTLLNNYAEEVCEDIFC